VYSSSFCAPWAIACHPDLKGFACFKRINTINTKGGNAMLWVLGILAALIALLLLVPLQLYLRVTGNGQPKWEAGGSWLGTVCADWVSDQPHFAAMKLRYKLPFMAFRNIRKGPGSNSAEERIHTVWHNWARVGKQNIQAINRLLKDIWQVFDCTIEGHGRYGFSDPAVTAWIYSIFAASRFATGFKKVALEPEFMIPGWWGILEITVSARPIYLVIPTVRFFNATVSQYINSQIRRRKKHGTCERNRTYRRVV